MDMTMATFVHLSPLDLFSVELAKKKGDKKEMK
jgi:hypothetical protein